MPLKITIPPLELGYNSQTKEFIYSHDKACVLTLEHSLVSISKWEARWKKPFLSTGELTSEETIDYIRCMTLTQNVDPRVYTAIDNTIIDKINSYVKDPMTATKFSNEDNKRHNSKVITSEQIYYWMTAMNIPPEYQKWHLNRLITLIRICGIESQPKKKMSNSEILARNKATNARNRARLRSRG